MANVKSYAVIGLGGFGISVAETLAQDGMEVMAIDIDKEKVNEIVSRVTYSLQMDVTNEYAMKSIGLERMDGVIIAIGEELEASVMATIICKEMNIPSIIVKAETELQRKILQKVGADQVILPEKESGYHLAKNIEGDFMNFFSLNDDISVVELPVKEEWAGKSLKDLDFRSTYHLNVISMRRSGNKEFSCFPDPDRKMMSGDIMIAAGKEEDIDKL